jgi:hypothetical protein
MANTKGATHVTPFAFCFAAPVEVTLKPFGLRWSRPVPHQAHRKHMARTTADVSGSNRIVLLGLENLPRSSVRKRDQ